MVYDPLHGASDRRVSQNDLGSSASFRSIDREVEDSILAGQPLEHRAEALQLVLDVGLILGVQVHAGLLGSIHAHTGPLADNLHRVDEVLQDGVVHSSECPAAWALLRGATAASQNLLLDLPLSHNDDMLPAELLLKLTDKTLLRCFLRARGGVLRDAFSVIVCSG